MAHNGALSNELTPAQQRAITALLSERDVTSAAISAHVSRRTLVRWMSEPSFKAALSRAEGDAIDTATRRLVGFQDAAIDKLGELFQNGSGEKGENIQLRASQAILDYLFKFRELRNTEERLAALEEVVYGKHRQKTKQP